MSLIKEMITLFSLEIVSHFWNYFETRCCLASILIYPIWNCLLYMLLCILVLCFVSLQRVLYHTI